VFCDAPTIVVCIDWERLMMDKTTSRTGILLETGTNEVEIIEIIVGKQSYGINVAKIREIIQFDSTTMRGIPQSHASILGLINHRGTTHALVDLHQHLYEQACDLSQKRVVLLTELNRIVVGFLVDGVNRIYRRSWADLQPIAAEIASTETPISGVVRVEDRDILMLDLEAILGEIKPESQLLNQLKNTSDESLLDARQNERANVHILFAEDSRFLREGLRRALKAAGYTQLSMFEDGQSAYEALSSWKRDAQKTGGTLKDRLQAVITDIEMPRMDGLTLCRKIKEDQESRDIPVMIYSSLINEQMGHKCESVGADDYVNKPAIKELVLRIDKICLG
jgi:two-component system chemotaxis response regulator CheV